MEMEAEAEIAPLEGADAAEVSAMLRAARAEYAVHFHPFAFDEASVRVALEKARRDRAWGLRVGRELAGIFMLRGFDAGFEAPAFGVFVAEEFAGRGLATRALAEATRWCEGNGVREMMLTVYAENRRAVRVYEQAGFVATDERQETRIVMRKKVGA
jgi:RimJ/RimL family protein N-acetyltransferase